MSLGSRIKQARGALSQKELAKIAGVSVRSLSYYEQDVRPPDAHFIAAVCAHFGLSADWLLFGRDIDQANSDNLQSEIDELREQVSKLTRERDQLIMEALDRKDHPDENSIVQVISLAECGTKGWQVLSGTKMWVEAPAEITRDSGFAAIAVGESMRPEGIKDGTICFCDTKRSPKKGDIVFVERSDGMVSLKNYVGETKRGGQEYIVVQGWLPASSEDTQKPFTWEILRSNIVRLAVVLYVKRSV